MKLQHACKFTGSMGRRLLPTALLAILCASQAAYAAEALAFSARPVSLAALSDTGNTDAAWISDVPDVFVAFTIPDSGAGEAVLSGPGLGLMSDSGSQQSSSSTGYQLSLSGQFVKPSYWRGDVYCAESCVSDGNGGWVYTYVTDYNPTQGFLYKVIREDGDWYVCENFGNDIWLKKEHCSPVTSFDIGVEVSDTRKKILETALNLLGKPYEYGASGPDRFDCSGFVNYCYQAAGLSAPRTSSEIGALANISQSELLPGDIVWRSGHVGIYVGNNQVIHSQNTGTGVMLNESPAAYSAFIRIAD